MTKQQAAEALKHAADALNSAAMDAASLGLVVEIFNLPFHTIGEAPCERISVRVLDPL